MGSILTDTSTPSLKRAIKENLFEFCRAAAQLSIGELVEDGSFSQWFFNVPYPWFNAVLAKRAGNEDDKPRIKQAIEYFHSKQIGPFIWWLDPDLSPADWESILHPLGFDYSDDTPGMAMDLSILNEDISRPANFKVTLVEDENALDIWMDVFIEGYGLPPFFRDRMIPLLKGLGYDMFSRNYIGFLNGKPVATSNVSFGAGVAGIQMIATLPEARGKGIGAAVTLEPLLDAQKMGYRAAILQSSEMGFSVYKRLGFKHLCQMEYFYYNA